MESYESVRDNLLNAWAQGQKSESVNNEEDVIAKTILASINTQSTESDFVKSIMEYSATFKDSVPDYIKIEFPRAISYDKDNFNKLNKTAIIKRIKSLSGLKVSIDNSHESLVNYNVKDGFKTSKNYKRNYLLKITVHLSHDDLMVVYADPSTSVPQESENQQ